MLQFCSYVSKSKRLIKKSKYYVIIAWENTTSVPHKKVGINRYEKNNSIMWPSQFISNNTIWRSIAKRHKQHLVGIEVPLTPRFLLQSFPIFKPSRAKPFFLRAFWHPTSVTWAVCHLTCFLRLGTRYPWSSRNVKCFFVNKQLPWNNNRII